MTRTDYEVLAQVLKEAFQRSGSSDIVGFAHSLADRLALLNPRFNRDKFLHAAGIKSGT